MKRIPGLVMAFFLLIIFIPGFSAQPCKPDSVSRVNQVDKPPMEQMVVRWEQTIETTGFWKSMVVGDITLTAMVGRFGDINFVNLEILDRCHPKREEIYKGTKGDKFVFTTKDGESLSFIATDVNNEIKSANNPLLPDFYSTFVVLSAYVQGEDMARMKTALTNKQIERVEVFLKYKQIRFKKKVDSKSAIQLAKKFNCFYQYLEDRGLSLLPVSNYKQASMDSVVGMYLRQGKSGDFLELRPDGTCSLFEGGHSGNGYFKLEGNVLIITTPEFGGRIGSARIMDDVLKDDDGIAWEKKRDDTAKPVDNASQEPEKSLSAENTGNSELRTQEKHRLDETAPPLSAKPKAEGPSTLRVCVQTKSYDHYFQFLIDGKVVWRTQSPRISHQVTGDIEREFKIPSGNHTLELNVFTCYRNGKIASERWNYTSYLDERHFLNCLVTTFGNIKWKMLH